MVGCLARQQLAGKNDGVGAVRKPVTDRRGNPVTDLASGGFPLIPQQQRQFIGPHEHQSDLLGTTRSHHRGRVKSSIGSGMAGLVPVFARLVASRTSEPFRTGTLPYQWDPVIVSVYCRLAGGRVSGVG